MKDQKTPVIAVDGRVTLSADCDAGGMELRDYFAAKAVQGLIASDADANIGFDAAARQAYGYADAMLAARERKGGA